ncbi:unnamed protein product [Strongylus vulgaris]|uniref:Sema domain-containing protein n=1 Tax=Strongylus vulgaris TaxID=40348 RepID=A0A3P7JG42_STRVU|nr:unnamed protein product [Strongylus vulgaris]
MYISGDSLIGAFSPSPSETRSAICAFSLQRLKLTFWYNIDRCRGGADSIGLPHVGRDAKCINVCPFNSTKALNTISGSQAIEHLQKSRIPLDEDTCELGVGGSIEAVEVAIAEVDQKITALSGIVSPRIVLAGTQNGQILQFKSKSLSNLEQYDSRSVEDDRIGSRVQQIDIRETTIYATLPNGLMTLPLASCHTLSICSACISSPDPMCQWCPATGKCSAAVHCPSATVNVCPEQNGPPSPASMTIDDARNISLPIKHLPQPDGFRDFLAAALRVVPLGHFANGARSRANVCQVGNVLR